MNWIKIKDGIIPSHNKTFLVYVPHMIEPCRKVHQTKAGIFDAFECGCGMRIKKATHYCEIIKPKEFIKDE